MSDDYTTLNPGVAGDSMDEEAVTYGIAPTTRKRPRVVIGGAAQAEIVRVLAADPTSTDYGVVVRVVFPAQATSATSAVGPMVQGVINDTPSAALIDGYIQPLSLTTDGRLRVSTVPARNSVEFFDTDDENQWGHLNANMSMINSPW